MGRQIGSQWRETLAETEYQILGWLDSQTVVLQDSDDLDKDKGEVWFRNDHHAGYTIEIDGIGYEFARSFKGDDPLTHYRPCPLCDGVLNNADAELCNGCWELKSRIERNPTIAQRILKELAEK